MLQVEFEKKYVLETSFTVPQRIAKSIDEYSIWQCYGKSKEDRYRATLDENNAFTFAKEKKKSLGLGASYSAQIEEDHSITWDVFIEQFFKSERWCAKRRIVYKDFYGDQYVGENHSMVIDYFVDAVKEDILEVPRLKHYEHHLVVAEVETLLDLNTTMLDLNFRLPVALRPYLLREIDKRDKDSKLFASYNLTPGSEKISHIIEVVNELTCQKTTGKN